MGTGIANAAAVQLGQSTPTMQVTAALAAGTRRGRVGVRRKRRTKAKVPRKRRASSKRGRKARMVKGSAAARRHMAKLRRMRKRR